MSTRYVWSKWSVNKSLSKTKENPYSGFPLSDTASTHVVYYSPTVSISSDGLITLDSPRQFTTTDSMFSLGRNYWYYDSYRNLTECLKNGRCQIMRRGVDDYQVWGYGSYSSDGPVEWYNVAVTKGSTSYGNVSSANSGAYPANSYSGNYWYVSLGSDTIDPVSLSYTDPVRAGGTVNLTITHSNGIVHGGTITYTIQTTTNGEDYYDAGTTTGTTFAVTVPKDAAIWNVRVYAKDDTGFVSTTYVYGNNVDTWVTVIQSEIVPASGDLGYLTSKNIVAVGVTHVSEQTYSISATLNGEPCFEKSGVAITDATYIILEDETWESIPQETEQTLDVTITFTGSTDTRNYTFKKFTYDDTSLEGVMEGTARAIRIKREYQTQILGKNLPKEIIKLDNPINSSGLKEATASEAQVFKGYTFFAGDSELRTGEALAEPTNVTPATLPPGVTAYNNNGQYLTGTGTEIFKGVYTYFVISFGAGSTSLTCDFIPLQVIASYLSKTAVNSGVKSVGHINNSFTPEKIETGNINISISGKTVNVSVTDQLTTTNPAWCHVYVFGI